MCFFRCEVKKHRLCSFFRSQQISGICLLSLKRILFGASPLSDNLCLYSELLIFIWPRIYQQIDYYLRFAHFQGGLAATVQSFV